MEQISNENEKSVLGEGLQKDMRNVVTEALATDLVLKCIFEHLGTKDLKNCRLVTRKWNQVACSELKLRRLFISNQRLPSWHNKETRPFSRQTVAAINFQRLIQCLESSTDFPFTGLHYCGWFWKVHKYNRVCSSRNVKNFFQLFGDRITRLSLDYGFPEAPSLVKLLRTYLPNVEELEVFKVGDFPKVEPTSKLLKKKAKGQNLSPLLALKTIILHHDGKLAVGIERFCNELIRCAPRLQRIENFHCALTGAVLEAGKMAAVASVHLTPKRSQLPHLRNLSAEALQLTSMTIDHNAEIYELTTPEARELGEAVFSILSSSSETLTHLRTAPLRTMEGSRLPVLKKLRSLHIALKIENMRNVELENRLSLYPAFPLTTQISATFPVLRKIRLEFQDDVRSFMNRYFGDSAYGDESVPTVELFELSCKFDSAGMAVLMKLFPNIVHIRLDWVKCTDSRPATDIWCLPPKLQKLELYGFRFPLEKAENAGVATDSFFTGIPQKTCSHLRASCVRDYKPYVSTRIRVNPAIRRLNPCILDLHELQELNVLFSFNGIVELRKICKGPLISPLSGLYGFNMMPQLNVHFSYDYRHKLARNLAGILHPVARFVTFRHRDSLNF